MHGPKEERAKLFSLQRLWGLARILWENAFYMIILAQQKLPRNCVKSPVADPSNPCDQKITKDLL